MNFRGSLVDDGKHCNYLANCAQTVDGGSMELPPGFRFHPLDHELLEHYLAPKVQDADFSVLHIGDVDLNRCEPWDLPGMAKMGEREWYFFASRDRKYPTGKRTNRATEAGYWKATGKDKAVMSSRSSSSSSGSSRLLGMKKTLVFYQGRAPKGEKTNWIMHEYRLESDCPDYSDLPTDSEWIICRIYKKNPGGKTKTHIKDKQTSSSYGESEALNGLPPLESPHPTASKDPGADSDVSLPDEQVTEYGRRIECQNIRSVVRSKQSYEWEPSIRFPDTSFAAAASVVVSDHLNAALPALQPYSYEAFYNSNQQLSHEVCNLSVAETGKMRPIRPPSLTPPPLSHAFDPSSSNESDQFFKAAMDNFHLLSRKCKTEPEEYNLGISHENPGATSSYKMIENTFVGDNSCLDLAAKDLSAVDQTLPYAGLFQSTPPSSWWT